MLRSASLEVLDVSASVLFIVFNSLNQLLGPGVKFILFVSFVLYGYFADPWTEFELLIKVDLHLDWHLLRHFSICHFLFVSLLGPLTLPCLFSHQISLECLELNCLAKKASDVVFDMRVVLFDYFEISPFSHDIDQLLDQVMLR